MINPLLYSIIFKSCLTEDIFPSKWKKENAAPIHKKKRQACFIENNLICENQSGFKPGNSCVNQLLAITHEIFSSFDNNYEVRGIFLDISRAFYKVWHEGIIHKLKRNGISGNLLSLLTDFLRNRKLRFKVHLGPISMLVFLKALYYARFYS